MLVSVLLQVAIAWYVNNLGALIKYQDDTWAALTLNGSIIALTLPNQHPLHVAYTLYKFSNFPAGHEIKYHRDGSAYLYLEDLDGNTIEYIYWPGGKKCFGLNNLGNG